MSNCEIFTPDEITKKMTDLLFENFDNFNSKQEQGCCHLLEPSVGTGNLLKYIFCETKSIYIDVFEIKKEYIETFKHRYNSDFLKNTNTNTNTNKNTNIFNEDFLKHDFKEKRYDLIISNPPYIKTQDLPFEYRKFLKNEYKDVFNNQSVLDIYYAFMIKCCLLLKETGGVFVCITPNSYLFNSSAKKLRKFLFENKLVVEIVDYGHQKVFDNVSVYCCITVIKKQKNPQKDFFIYNDQKTSFDTFVEKNFQESKEIKKLGDVCIIKNGIATLRNKIFIHDQKLYEEEDCWVKVTNGSKEQYIIYPYYYNKDLNKTKCIEEEVFKEKYPKTYQFLLSKKDELAKRDKQNQQKYPIWYAYGRSQSIDLKDSGSCEKIIIPCLINPLSLKERKCIYIKPEKNLLHYNSISIQIKEKYKNKYSIEYIVFNCLTNEKNINYLIQKSSKRSSGWLNISTRIIGNFIFSDD